MPTPPEKPAWLDQQPTWLTPPPPAQPAAEPQPEPPMGPAWSVPAPRSNRLWIYLTGLVLIVLIAAGGFLVRGQILAWQAAGSQQIVETSPTPFLSDYERADRFLNIQMGPAFAALITPLQSVEKECSVDSMVPACKPDLIATDKALIAGEDTINHGDIPICVGPATNQFKFDWIGMEQGVALAISGYAQNSYDLYLQGMVKFAEIARYIQGDMNKLTAAEKTCSNVPR